MATLGDTQRIILSTASQRESGSLFPLPNTLKPGGGITKAIASLSARELAERRQTSVASETADVEGDVRFGLFITAAGLAAIGIDKSTDEVGVEDAAPIPLARVPKTGIVIGMLRRSQGASIPELIEATDWLPHTTRAALTGLRKKGHTIERGKRDGVTCYRIVAAG